MENNDISILKQKQYQGSYCHQDTIVREQNLNSNQTLLTNLETLVKKTNFNLLEINPQTKDSITNKKIRIKCQSDKHLNLQHSKSIQQQESRFCLEDMPKIDSNQSFSFLEALQDQGRASIQRQRNLSNHNFQLINNDQQKSQMSSNIPSPFIPQNLGTQFSFPSYVFDTVGKDQTFEIKRKIPHKLTLKDKLVKSQSTDKFPTIRNLSQQKPLKVKKMHLLMEKDTFQEYVDGLQTSNITMEFVMNQLIKRKNQQLEKKSFQERLQEKDEISKMSKSILSHTNSNSTMNGNSSPRKTFVNKLSFKVPGLAAKASNKILAELQNGTESPNCGESPNNDQKSLFTMASQISPKTSQQEFSNLNQSPSFAKSPIERRSLFTLQRQQTIDTSPKAATSRKLQTQKTMELKPRILPFLQKAEQMISPPLQKLIFKQPIKKQGKNDSESNSDEYMDDVGDLGDISKINTKMFQRRINSVRNEVIVVQNQLGPYVEQVKNTTNELKTQLDMIIDLYKNEQRVIAAMLEIITEFQKSGMSLSSVFILKDIFFSQDQKKLKASQINFTAISNYIAKQTVRQYDQDGNLLPPKVNTEVLKALEDISKQLKSLIYQKKIQNLKAVEYESKQSINSFNELKNTYFNLKDPIKQEQLDQQFKEYQNTRTIIGPECRNYSLLPLIDYFHQKFKYNINLDFDLQERKINENMESMIDTIKDELYENEVMSKFGMKSKQKEVKKSSDSSDSDEENNKQ